jgi:hypothetical protein
MELNFTKIDNLWVAEFEVNGNVNLHIERAEGGYLSIGQRTAGNNYAYIADAQQLDSKLTIDEDIQGVIYPKNIKVASAVKPTVAIVTEA